MKKYIISIFALAAAVACSKMGSEPVQQPNSPSEKIPGIEYEKLVVNTGAETKTSLNGTSCAWSEGDSFKVFDDQTDYASENTFSMTGTDSFEGEVPVGTEDFYAVYGTVGSASGSSSSFTASVTISETQTPVANGFDPAAHVAVAHGTRTPGSTEPVDVTFTTFNRLIKITVPANVTRVVLSSNTAIAGTMTMNCTSEGTLSMTGNATANSVTLSNGGVIPEGTYYLCVAPVNMEGFQMTYTFTDGSTYTKSAAKTLEMASSNQIRNLTISTFPLSLEGFQTSYTYYLAGDKSTANARGSQEIKAGTASVTSLKEGQTLSLECNGALISSISSGNEIHENAKTKDNGTYVYKAYIQNEDGFVTDEKVITSYVTGLPATYTARNTYSGWSIDFTNNTTNTYSMYNGQTSTSPAYALPATSDIKVTVSLEPSAGTTGTFNCNGYTKDYSSSASTLTFDITLQPNATISLSTTNKGTLAGWRYTKLNSTKIEYR